MPLVSQKTTPGTVSTVAEYTEFCMIVPIVPPSTCSQLIVPNVVPVRICKTKSNICCKYAHVQIKYPLACVKESSCGSRISRDAGAPVYSPIFTPFILNQTLSHILTFVINFHTLLVWINQFGTCTSDHGNVKYAPKSSQRT